MIRIGFDAKRLFNNFTGLGNYSRTLVRNLATYFPEAEYHLYTPKIQDHEETNYFANSPMYGVRQPRKNRKFLWRSRGILADLNKDDIQLFHGLSHEIPLGIERTNIRSVVTIHDLIFRHYPQQYGWFDRQVYDYKFRSACQRADRVIAISESTKRDVVEFYKISPDKIEVIYQGCHEGFLTERSVQARREVREEYQLPTTFMLYVGSLIERKNLLGVIEAMYRLPAADRLPLVIVGQGPTYRKRVEKKAQEYGLHDLLYFVKPRFSQLPALYQQAQLFLYPSYYEGFGIPILEALNSRTPVLTSNISSLPEAAGTHACQVAPDNYEEMAAGIGRILQDGQLRAEMIAQGLVHAQQFRGEPLTKQLMELYQSI